MLHMQNFLSNDDVKGLEKGGPFQIIQYERDLSCSPADAQLKYFMSQMGVKKKQIVCQLNNESIILQAGAMQWFGGSIRQTSGIKGVGDLFKKSLTGKATGESAIKPEYTGSGVIVTEPSYRHYLIEKVEDWNSALVVQDGMFAAAQGSVVLKTVMRSNLSSAVAGGEGLFNLCLTGQGYVVLECAVPREELIILDLDNDEVKIDGNFAVAWSNTLQFSVERSGSTLMGSAASGEGLVNVYRGTGRILMMPQV